MKLAWKSTLLWVLVAVALDADHANARGVPVLAADLNSDPGSRQSVNRVSRAGDQLFLTARDGADGFELWRLDSATVAPTMVADIWPGPGSASPSEVADLNGVALFAANDGVHGRELWRSDGTAAGTRLVLDIVPGPRSSAPGSWLVAGDLLFFVAEDGHYNHELWRSDGTAAGTYPLLDLPVGIVGAPVAARLFFVVQGHLWVTDGTQFGTTLLHDRVLTRPVAFGEAVYFGAEDGTSGRELWRSDGSPAGTGRVLDLVAGPPSSDPLPLGVLGDRLYFSAVEGPYSGASLWRTDGTAEGTELVLDVSTFGEADDDDESHASVTSRFWPIGDYALFLMSTPVGSGLWRTDGTAEGTLPIADINPGKCARDFTDAVAVGDRAFMIGAEQGGRREIWTTDGTAEGTRLVKGIFPSAVAGSSPRWLTSFGDHLYFTARDGVRGRELWKSDGTEQGTSRLSDVFQGTGHAFGHAPGNELATRVGDRFYVTTDAPWQTWRIDVTTSPVAVDTGDLAIATETLLDVGDDGIFFAHSGDHLWNLWRGDPFGESTKVTDLGGLTQPPRASAELNGDVFFPFPRSRGTELWKVSLETGATVPVFARSTGSTPEWVLAMDDAVLFVANDSNPPQGTQRPPVSRSLWRTDGTSAGTVPLLEVDPAVGEGVTRRPIVLGGRTVFFADDGIHGEEVWGTDGTPSGTLMLADAKPGAESSIRYPWSGPTPVHNGLLFYTANDGVHGEELWRTDGTLLGTYMLADFTPGSEGSRFRIGSRPGQVFLLVAAGGFGFSTVLGGGYDAFALWSSDGTREGTAPIKQVISELAGPKNPIGPVAFGEHVYFVGSDPFRGQALWRSDGTVEGTGFVAAVQLPRVGSGSVPQMIPMDDFLYFNAIDPEHGEELWRTDGTQAGTMLAGDIRPGPRGSALHRLEEVEGRLYFVANDESHGYELWTLSCGNGAIEADEECDDGAANGQRGSCCSAACELRTEDRDSDGTPDWCDPEEGEIELSRLQLARHSETSRRDDRVSVRGEFSLPPGGFEIASGLHFRLDDAAGNSVEADFPAAKCRERNQGIRCGSSSPPGLARFRRTASHVEFQVRLKELDLGFDFTPPFTATLTHEKAIDQRGSIASCHGGSERLSCR